MKTLHANCRIWLYTPDAPGVFGDGKMRLLEEIAAMGSLRKAAEVLKISYRKAWSDLAKAESCLGVSLIVRKRGGTAGGSTMLTPHGIKIISAYKKFHEHVARELQLSLNTYFTGVFDELHD